MAFLRAYMREGRCGKTTAPKGARTCSKQPHSGGCRQRHLQYCFLILLQQLQYRLYKERYQGVFRHCRLW